MEFNNYLYELLKVYWLRPETVLFRYPDILSMEKFEFESPSMDLGCGDGVFSFIRGGGQFDNAYDVFEVANLDKFYTEKADIFDTYNSKKDIKIIKPAEYKIDFAFDHKQALLQKAERLGLYKNFVQGDANEKLPFDDDCIKSVFSNILYWLDDPGAVLKEIYRILQKDGKCCLMLPTPKLVEYSFYNKYYKETKNENMKFLDIIDRGRTECWKGLYSKREWDKMITDAGFEIEQCNPHISDSLFRIWDIGLRPLFPLLCKLVQSIDNKDKIMEIKKEWVELFYSICEPLIMNDVNKDDESYCYYCYIIRK